MLLKCDGILWLLSSVNFQVRANKIKRAMSLPFYEYPDIHISSFEIEIDLGRHPFKVKERKRT